MPKRMPMMKPVLLALMLALPLAAPAAALEPINKDARLNATLLQGFIADKIADNCPTMKPRKMRAVNELFKLRDYALAKGYSHAEVKAFVESKTEKARGKAEADAWLKAQGATPGQTEVYCRLGKEEIAKKSLIGQLLRSTR